MIETVAETRHKEENFLHPECDLQGWYVAARSKSLKSGDVRSVDMLHRKIALYRGEDGQVRAVDAVCAHLGANLGHGSVIGNDLECAFHGWRYGTDGICNYVPHVENPPRRKLRQYPVQEKWGLIWIFNGAKPLWDLPEPDEGLFPLLMPSVQLGCHPHLMIANGLDGAHFEPLHHMQQTETPYLTVDEPYEVTLYLCGRSTHPFWRRLTATRTNDIRAHFKTIGANMAWVTVEEPVKCYFLFTGQPSPKGCRSQVVLFLPRSIQAIRAIVTLYLLLQDDNKILSDINFKPGFIETDEGLQAFVNIVNNMPTG